MHAVVRTYSGPGAKELFDLLEKQNASVEAAMRSVPGFVSYTAVRTGDGGVTLTVCDDKQGTEASVRVAKDWIRKNASTVGSKPPAIAEGSVVVQIG